jgi:hypothetical protein
MSGPITDDIRRTADSQRELADHLRELADGLLNDDNALNDVFASDLLEQAAEHDLIAGLLDALADVIDWFGDD